MLHSFLNGPPTTKLSTLSLHDALPISSRNSTPRWAKRAVASPVPTRSGRGMRSLRAIGWNAASALALAGACARPHPSPLTPAAAPEPLAGLIAGAPSVTLGGDGEPLVTDDSTGEP